MAWRNPPFKRAVRRESEGVHNERSQEVKWGSQKEQTRSQPFCRYSFWGEYGSSPHATIASGGEGHEGAATREVAARKEQPPVEGKELESGGGIEKSGCLQ